MAIEEEIELRHYLTGEKIAVKAKRTGKEGEYIAHCLNPQAHAHGDKNPSMGISITKGVYNCFVCHISGQTWAKYLETRGKSSGQNSKKYLQKKEEAEVKESILLSLSTDILNWKGYDPDIKERVRSRLSFDLPFLPNNEKIGAISSLVEAGIFRKSELLDRLKIVESRLKKFKLEKKKEEKKVKAKTLIPGLIHLVKENEKVSYLLQNDEKLYIEEEYKEGEEKIYRPKQELPYYHCEPDILKMNREIDLPKLLKDIEHYIRDYLELPDWKDYFILALWVFHTYIMEKFNTTPFLYFHGVYASGKSRAGDILMDLAFRGWSMTSPTEASLFRPIQYFEPTIHLDHVRFFGSETNQAVKLLLQSRYRRGLKVVRNDLQIPGERGVGLYNVFGATVISTEDTISGALKSRSITFVMKENISRKVEKIFFDKDKAKNIRDRLIIFRANYINKDLSEAFPSIARRRLAEILYPLNKILATVAPERRGELEEVIKKLQGEVTDEMRLSIDSEIVNCLVNYYNETKELTIPSSILADKVNIGRPDNERYKTNSISRECHKLTFKRKLFAKYQSRSAFIIDLKLLEELSEKYDTTKIEKDLIYQSHKTFPA